MFYKFKRLLNSYPRQFWLLFVGLLISTTGASMIWPFLILYVSKSLELPLAIVTTLTSINAAVGLVFAFIAGPLIDRVGRKGVMVASLAANGLIYLFYNQAHSYGAFALLMALSGAVNPLYRVGADAMMADLIPVDRRADAYSLLRMSNNVGVALGPAIGGILAATSYAIAFYVAAAGMIIYSLLVAFQAVETLPQRASGTPERERFGGYGRIIKDWPFMSFVGAFTLTSVCAAIMWVLLAVYTNKNFNLPENQYGFIPTVNALMVVFLQISFTQWTKRRPALLVLALGSFFYAVGVGSVALGQGFTWFLGSMVVMTIGELIVTPTATTLASNLAPTHMRGRYMSIYGLTWGVGSMIGPVLGGFLSDSIGPRAIWVGAFVVGLLSTSFFMLLWNQLGRRGGLAKSQPVPVDEDSLKTEEWS